LITVEYLCFHLKTVSLGFGAPPIQPISLLIILVVSIGLGIPFVLIIAGVVFIIVKRCREGREGYSRISGGYEEIN
jgi:Lysosomal transcription factor, NCU-G1